MRMINNDVANPSYYLISHLTVKFMNKITPSHMHLSAQIQKLVLEKVNELYVVINKFIHSLLIYRQKRYNLDVNEVIKKIF